MNTLKTNLFFITILNFLGVLVGALGSLYMISLIAREDFVRLLLDPSMIIVISVCALVNAIYAFMKTNRLKKAVAAR